MILNVYAMQCLFFYYKKDHDTAIENSDLEGYLVSTELQGKQKEIVLYILFSHKKHFYPNPCVSYYHLMWP